jgi:hypothetical protein
VFEASRSFTFFDYFRIPYEVKSNDSAPVTVSSRGSVHQLRAVSQSRDESRSLFWYATEPRRRADQVQSRLGKYRLHGFTFFGQVALSATVPDLLSGTGSGWRQAEPILDGDGSAVAAIWRDTAGNVFLPFDPGEAMLYFWSEGYKSVGRSPLSAFGRAGALRAYYAVRPALPRLLQLRLRRVFTRVQGRSSFPEWPVEDSLNNLYEWLFTLAGDVAGRPVPYLDLWPDGKSWAFVLTHDVETEVGLREMRLLRDPERKRGYVSSWNLVGERYAVDGDTVQALHDERCEVGVHGLRHDGRDLASRRLMEQRLPAMRAFASRWGAVGFRSPATQRDWRLMPRLGFEYDTSYSDTDPYEPQPGGCCTYLPYFNEQMVELPITMPQDHTLFMILQHPDASVWLRKAEHIRAHRGMVLILTHPDYADDPRLTHGYDQLLETFQDDESVWHALAQDVASWWQQRAASFICASGEGWFVEGPASARGRIRFAPLESDAECAGDGFLFQRT